MGSTAGIVSKTRRSGLSPEEDLLHAMINSAIEDARGHFPSSVNDREAEYRLQHARWWLWSREEAAIHSRVIVANCLNVEEDYFGELALRKLEWDEPPEPWTLERINKKRPRDWFKKRRGRRR